VIAQGIELGTSECVSWWDIILKMKSYVTF
jgi:hypothetical protein